MRPSNIELTFGSQLCFLDLVQDVSDKIGEIVGFDKNGCYWVSLSVCESVTNAILHGNREDAEKKVRLKFTILKDRLIIRVQDEGKGFDEQRLPNPLDPQNTLKPSGRGILYVRSFMDDVKYRPLTDGGWEVCMEKRLNCPKGDANDH